MEKSTSLVSGASKSSAGNPLFVNSIKGNIKQKYHFKEKLASGGFGVVYLAEDRQTKELFAVKAIQQKKVKDYATFVNEINILRVLVSLFDQNDQKTRTIQTSSSSMRYGNGVMSVFLFLSKSILYFRAMM